MAPVEFSSELPPSGRRSGYALAGLVVGVSLLGIAWHSGSFSPAPYSATAPNREIPAPTPLPPVASTPIASQASPAASPDAGELPAIHEAQALLADAGPSITGSPTGEIVCQRATEKIRRASQLAQRGAFFASRRELLDVLQMIAEAKDQKHGSARRTLALAAGLHALDEAEDFHVRAADFDPSATLRVLLSSHRTPIAAAPSASSMLPQQLADVYYRYAQLQLGAAVANEPAGSMALHALGKLYSQIGRLEAETAPQADRRAFAMQQAAVLARPDNYLARHELGVLLAESGHYGEAEQALVDVAGQQPHPTAFRNLARVQRKLGRPDYATANDAHAEMLAAQSAPSNGAVIWTNRDQFAAAGEPVQPAPMQNAVRPGNVVR